MHRFICVLAMASIMCFLCTSLSGDEKKDFLKDLLENLSSKDHRMRWKAGEPLQKIRDRIVKKSIELAGQDPGPNTEKIGGKEVIRERWKEPKHLGMLLLAEYRAKEAIPVLIKNLEYSNRKHFATDYDNSWSTWYPAAEALAEIGMPSVEALFEELSGIPKLNLRRKLCGNILVKILGKELAASALKNFMSDVKDEKKKANLEEALKFIKNWTEKDKSVVK